MTDEKSYASRVLDKLVDKFLKFGLMKRETIFGFQEYPDLVDPFIDDLMKHLYTYSLEHFPDISDYIMYNQVLVHKKIKQIFYKKLNKTIQIIQAPSSNF